MFFRLDIIIFPIFLLFKKKVVSLQNAGVAQW